MDINKLKRSNVIYKITQDLDLEGKTWIVPVGCVLDFQGGRIINGTVNLNSALILPMGIDVNKYIYADIVGNYYKGQIVYDNNSNSLKLFDGSYWRNIIGEYIYRKGNHSDKPLNNSENIPIGSVYFDTNEYYNKPSWWNGNKWVDANGIKSDMTRGFSSSRPLDLNESDYGFQYFDKSINKPIWWTGTKWVDATGADV